MTRVQVITGGLAQSDDLQHSGRQKLMLVHGLRSGLMVAVFALALVFQFLQGEFLSPAIWLPVYAVLAVLFSLNTIYFLIPSWCEDRSWVHGGLFAIDAIAITLMVHYTGASQSIFFFLYSVDIILAGLVFQRRGAFTQALWTSVLFGLLLLLAPQANRENLYFLASLNNLAFFSVAYLSGSLSEQINFMGLELKRTVRNLEMLQDLNKLIVENVGTGLLTVDLAGDVVSANPAASRILDGLELVGRNINLLFPGIQLAGNVVQLRAAGQEVRHMDLEFHNRRKEKQIVEVVISPLYDEQKKPRGYVLMFQDRTEIRRLEAEMRKKEKLAAVGQLAAGIAHEIRNPLASLSGSVQMMISTPEKYADEDLKLMRIITREIDRLNELITEFLDYVRPEGKPDQMVDINKVLREVMEIVRFNPQLPAKVNATVELKAGSMIQGRADKLKQAFLNIVMNAYQAMEKSQRQDLRVESLDVQGRVVVRISDTGSGMDEATRNRLFEPFFTTKPRGTGLGLAVTHKIFESHGATIQVESVPGEGTTFTIDFPGEQGTYEPIEPKFKQA